MSGYQEPKQSFVPEEYGTIAPNIWSAEHVTVTTLSQIMSVVRMSRKGLVLATLRKPTGKLLKCSAAPGTKDTKRNVFFSFIVAGVNKKNILLKAGSCNGRATTSAHISDNENKRAGRSHGKSRKRNVDLLKNSN